MNQKSRLSSSSFILPPSSFSESSGTGPLHHLLEDAGGGAARVAGLFLVLGGLVVGWLLARLAARDGDVEHRGPFRDDGAAGAGVVAFHRQQHGRDVLLALTA